MDKCHQLAEAITRVFQTGIELGPAVLHYIDSTFAYPRSEEIEAILADSDHPDRDSLIELVFFPDESVQLQLEDLLEQGRYASQDERAVKRILAAGHCTVRIRFTDQRADICLPLPPEAVDSLVTRLRIPFRLPARIIDLIERVVPENRRGPVKVRCRNSRVSFDEGRSLLFGQLLQALAEDGQLVECVDFILRFFEEVDSPGDFYDALVRRKHTLGRDIQKMEKCNALLNRNNFETLVMRGIRIPLIDIDAARKQIQMIDKICIAVYGTAGSTVPWTADTDAIDCRTQEDIKKLIRRLTVF